MRGADRQAVLAAARGQHRAVVSHSPTVLPFASVFLRSLRGDEILVETRLLSDDPRVAAAGAGGRPRAHRRALRATVRPAGARRLREIRVVQLVAPWSGSASPHHHRPAPGPRATRVRAPARLGVPRPSPRRARAPRPGPPRAGARGRGAAAPRGRRRLRRRRRLPALRVPRRPGRAAGVQRRPRSVPWPRGGSAAWRSGCTTGGRVLDDFDAGRVDLVSLPLTTSGPAATTS